MSGVAAADAAQVHRVLQRPGGLGAHTVYECPDCGEQFVGQQRCPECQRFCRAVGLGGACPDCDAVILLRDVLAEEVPPTH